MLMGWPAFSRLFVLISISRSCSSSAPCFSLFSLTCLISHLFIIYTYFPFYALSSTNVERHLTFSISQGGRVRPSKSGAEFSGQSTLLPTRNAQHGKRTTSIGCVSICSVKRESQTNQKVKPVQRRRLGRVDVSPFNFLTLQVTPAADCVSPRITPVLPTSVMQVTALAGVCVAPCLYLLYKGDAESLALAGKDRAIACLAAGRCTAASHTASPLGSFFFSPQAESLWHTTFSIGWMEPWPVRPDSRTAPAATMAILALS